MDKIKLLLAQRKEKLDEIDKLLSLADGDGRDLTEDETAKFVALENGVAEIDRSIGRLQRLDEMREQQASISSEHEAAEIRSAAAESIPGPRVISEPGEENLSRQERRDLKKYSFMKVLRAAADSSGPTPGNARLSGLELEMHQEAVRLEKDGPSPIRGIGIPQMVLQSAGTRRMDLTAGTDSEGGYTIATEVRPIIDILRERLVTRAAGATFLSGLVGDVSFPKATRGTDPAHKTENASSDEYDPTFGQLLLSPSRLPAKIDLSRQLIRQSSEDIENWSRDHVAFILASVIDKSAINGDGVGANPLGILNDSIGDVPVDAVPSWADILALESDVATANADFGTLTYVTTPAMRGVLKGTAKVGAVPPFIWEGNSMNGYRALISTNIPSNLGVGTDEHAIIFGNFAQLMIAQWGGLDVIVDPYTLADTSLVRFNFETFYDTGLRHTGAFSAIQDGRLS